MASTQIKSSHSTSFRLRKVKAALLAVSLTLAGVVAMMLSAWLTRIGLPPEWQWLALLPIGEVGGALFAAGVLSTLFEYTFRRDQERAVTTQFRQVISEQAPALRDAVIKGFRFDTADLRRIATPQLLDELAENSLGLRFGDADFGREVYRDIRHQAISAEERWYDARIDAALGIPRGRSVAPTSFFDFRVRWDYTVVPKHRFRSFVIVSDRARYEQLAAERGPTSVWFHRPTPGIDITNPELFSLDHFSVDGKPLAIQRHVDAISQSYVVDLGEAAVSQAKPVVVSFAFHARVPRDGHVVHINIDRPTRGLAVDMRYDEAISRLRLMDFASRGDGGHISDDPAARSSHYRYDGWLFPRAGLVYAWTLTAEAGVRRRSSTPDARHAQKAGRAPGDARSESDKALV